ncbi:MAG: 2-succinyl-6-hydroxy-2,4-cyclohexadiene-1-carboxylate synthase [Candidatus Zixiibacteriota bacterium]|nr:MAG: 2-succinyl-6-hydroxy-2,4-cyclohexadiene-1-carboxylate synthase [candidate division Zixibacteria bacterium]
MKNQVEYFYDLTGNQESPMLVFLHGFMGCLADWETVTAGLSKKRRCMVVDLPGHGRTVVGQESDYTMESCAAEIVKILDRLSVPKAGVVGYSMGGRLALFLAVHYPDRFNKVVLESASPGLATEQERKDRIAQDKKLAGQIGCMAIEEFVEQWYRMPLFAALDKDSDEFRAMYYRRLENDPHNLGLSLRMMGTGAQPSLWERLGAIEADVLLIVGQHDIKFTGIARQIAERCRSARIVIVDGTGHNVHFENPDEYVKQVSLFLES